IYTIGMGLVPHSEETISTYSPSNYWFTTEYDLRMISDKSTGNYRYIDSQNEIRMAFQGAFDDIEQAAITGTRSDPGTRSIGPWTDWNEIAREKYINTGEIDLTYADTAELSFNHKYNLEREDAGGIIEVYHQDETKGYGWEYVLPDQPYTGSFDEETWAAQIETDFLENDINWCWNGMSGGGTMDWDHVTLDLSDYLGKVIKIRFRYIHYEGGTGYGWFLDDVTVKTSTQDSNPNKDLTVDNWALITAATPGVQSYSGDHAWFCGVNSKSGDLNDGVDNSLYTRQIDLTSVRTAGLQAMVKFNLDQEPGRPPDGFRIEVSTNNMETWVPLTLGVRSSWGVSGTQPDGSDGILNDGKSYTGLEMDGTKEYWVPINTLTRVNADLSAFTGSAINIRFRIVTNNVDANHYDDDPSTVDPLFRGIYIDDVMIYGETQGSTRSGAAYLEEPVLGSDGSGTLMDAVSQDSTADEIRYEPAPQNDEPIGPAPADGSIDEPRETPTLHPGPYLFAAAAGLVLLTAVWISRPLAGKIKIGYRGV
ncbi:MAG: hypothetical protein ACMUFK_04365, partial [Thermoplasmatota archaeon]